MMTSTRGEYRSHRMGVVILCTSKAGSFSLGDERGLSDICRSLCRNGTIISFSCLFSLDDYSFYLLVLPFTTSRISFSIVFCLFDNPTSVSFPCFQEGECSPHGT